MIICRTSCNVVNHEGSCGSSIVRPRHCSEPFLTGGVPDLEFYLLSRHFDDPGTEFDADRVRAICHDWKSTRNIKIASEWNKEDKPTFFFRELMEQTRLPDSHIPDDDVFKYVRIIIRTRRHDLYKRKQYVKRDGFINYCQGLKGKYVVTYGHDDLDYDKPFDLPHLRIRLFSNV